MTCCKVGCNGEVVAEQEIAFKNHQGYIVRTKIQWCEKHRPECILEDFTHVDLLKHGGY